MTRPHWFPSNRQPTESVSHQYKSIGIGGVPAVDPPIDDQEAKEVLTAAWAGMFDNSSPPNLFALGIAQAIGLMEGKYGKWGPNNASNNWGAITKPANSDGSCPAGSFQHTDSNSAGQHNACFKVYATSLEGAEDLLRELYLNRPAVFQAAVDGDIRAVAQGLYSTHYYEGTAPPDEKAANGDFTNVNNYIAFIGHGIDQIADLYPHGDSVASGDKSSNTGLIFGVAAAAVLGLALAFK